MNEFDIIKRDVVIEVACNIAAENGINITLNEVLSKDRSEKTLVVRMMCAWHLKKVIGYSWEQTGELMNRNHSSIINSCSNHDSYVESSWWPAFLNVNYKVLYSKICDELQKTNITKVIPITNSIGIDLEEFEVIKKQLEDAEQSMIAAQKNYLHFSKRYIGYLHRSRAINARNVREIERDLN